MSQDQKEFRRWCWSEIEKWKQRIQECPHCAECRRAIVDIYNTMPPEPIILSEEKARAFMEFQRASAVVKPPDTGKA